MQSHQEREKNVNQIALILQKISGDSFESTHKMAKLFEEEVFLKTKTKEEYVFVIKQKLKKILKQSIVLEKKEPGKEKTNKKEHCESGEQKSINEGIKRAFEDKLSMQDTYKERFFAGLSFIRTQKINEERFLFFLRKIFSSNRRGFPFLEKEKWSNVIKKNNYPYLLCYFEQKEVIFKLFEDKPCAVSISTTQKNTYLMEKANQILRSKKSTTLEQYMKVFSEVFKTELTPL